MNELPTVDQVFDALIDLVEYRNSLKKMDDRSTAEEVTLAAIDNRIKDMLRAMMAR